MKSPTLFSKSLILRSNQLRRARYDDHPVAGALLLLGAMAAGILLTPTRADAEVVPGTLDAHWDEGSVNCKTSSQPALQVHRYNPETFILRENLCVTFEAPFMYLLVGSSRALLIDTGDVSRRQARCRSLKL